MTFKQWAAVKTTKELVAVKTTKEIAKLDLELGQARKVYRLEIFKVAAAILGPLMTGLTVVGAIWIGLHQISAKSQSDEDALWRETVKGLDATPAKDIGKTHLVTFLKPYLSPSSRYRPLAIDVTLDELPKIHEEHTFTDLFSAVFVDTDLTSLPRLLRLDKDLSDQSVLIYPYDHPDRIPPEWYQIINLSAIVCEPIASILHKFDHALIKEKLFGSNRPGQGDANVSGKKIPMNYIYFQSCDFSNIDFSDIDLSGTTFFHVRLDGAILAGVGDDPHLWYGEAWWRAKYIEKGLLAKLIAKYKPNQFDEKHAYAEDYRDSEIIRESEWVENIKRLCRAVALDCTDAMIKAKFS